jgi:RimJ/RimL family protein N-acetyltransferase
LQAGQFGPQEVLELMEEQLFRLPSGDLVLVRPLRRDDAQALATAVEQLSEQSRYRRFHSSMPELSAQTLDYLTDIDHHDHEALVAVVPGLESIEVLGVARFIRDAAIPDTAEMAVLVVDAWQRRGLGTLLIRELARRATEVGISHFTAEILTENAPTLALVHQLGDADITDHGQTMTARMDSARWQPGEDRGARSLLRALSGTNAALVPRVVRAMLKLSTKLTRTLVIPVTPLLDQARKRAG